MDRTGLLFALSALFLLTAGCVNGIFNGTFDEAFNGTFNGTIAGGIYSHTVEPITFNRGPTEITNDMGQARGSINQLQPVSVLLSVRLGKNGLGDIAKEHGLKTVYYADLESRSVFFGIWRQDIVHIYGR